jgi:hypothetical protein
MVNVLAVASTDATLPRYGIGRLGFAIGEALGEGEALTSGVGDFFAFAGAAEGVQRAMAAMQTPMIDVVFGFMFACGRCL